MVVVDCSVVVDALTGGQGVDDLRRTLVGNDLHAPDLLDVEVVSALRGLVLCGRLSAYCALDALTDFDDLPLQRWPCLPATRRRAFEMRDNVSTYDAVYVALAEDLGCPLLTRDARLARSVGHRARVEVV